MGIVSLLCACVACAANEDSAPPLPGSGGGGGSAGRAYVGPGGSPAAGSPSTAVAGAGTAGALAGAGGAGGAGTGGSGVAGTAGSSVAGTGGTGGSLPPAPSVCDGDATRILANTPADALVDDFEAPMLSTNWSRFSDVMPVPNSFEILHVTTDGAATTMNSGRYQGTGANTLPNGGYGVGTVYNVAIIAAQGLSCVDVSAFDGISFWAKAGTDALDPSVDVNFVVPQTNAIADGGDCADGCYNHPRKRVYLTSEWTQYTVMFSEVTQGSHPVKDRLQMLAFLVPEAENWDYSLDEIAWFKDTAPTGPVGP